METSAPPSSPDLLQRLEQHQADPRNEEPWNTGTPDYRLLYGLTNADVPRLLEIARLWVTRTDWPEDETDLTIYAPLHAWRALAQLRAVETTPALLIMLEEAHRQEDDWYVSDFRAIMTLFGAQALPALEAYLRDPVHADDAGATVASALAALGKQHPEARLQIISTLVGVLAQHSVNAHFFNASLVAGLLELQAVEAADDIERAFAADRVERDYCGNWAAVRKELNVPGHGWVSETLANQRGSYFSHFEAMQKAIGQNPGPIPTANLGASSSDLERQRRRAQKKRERQNKKRNRR